MHNFAAKIVLGLRKYHHISVKYHHRLFLHDAVMVHKCLHGTVPSYFSDQFIRRSAIHKRATRFCNDLHLPKCRLATGQRMFSYRGVKLYNDLPREVKDIKNTKLFKKKLRNEQRKNSFV